MKRLPRIVIVDIAAADTHPLRLSVLRVDTPTKVVDFAEDEWPGTWHLGATIGDALVGTSTWVPRHYGAEPAVQLRGMATARHLQGHGVGGVLLEAGCARVFDANLLVWARARDAALGFYLRHDFEVVGDGFVDEATQLPHHLIVRRQP
jgi:GNAT superfamily N-acetyltransferase